MWKPDTSFSIAQSFFITPKLLWLWLLFLEAFRRKNKSANAYSSSHVNLLPFQDKNGLEPCSLEVILEKYVRTIPRLSCCFAGSKAEQNLGMRQKKFGCFPSKLYRMQNVTSRQSQAGGEQGHDPKPPEVNGKNAIDLFELWIRLITRRKGMKLNQIG